MRLFLFFVVMMFYVGSEAKAEDKANFIGYNIGEMAFNGFQGFAGEVGHTLGNGNTIKFGIMDVDATEEHLSSGFANAVDGDNVEGTFQGMELFYNFNLKSGWYWGPSVGYYREEYRHVVLDESVGGQSATLGLSFGYRDNSIFGVSWLYYDFSLPVRYSINSFDDTKLGGATVSSNKIRTNIWFTIGAIF